MWQLPQQPLTTKQVLQESYALFKTTFNKMHRIIFLFFALLAVPYIMAGFFNFAWMDILQPVYAIKTGALFAIYLIAVFWLYGAYYHQLNTIMRSQPMSAADSLLKVFKKLPLLIAAFIIAAVANFIGAMLLLIPAIYLIPVFTLYYPLIVIDDLGPVTGLKKALYLIKKNWWHTAIVLLTPLIISFLLMAITSIAAVFIGIIFHLPAVIMDIIYAYEQIILGCLFLPISATVNSMQIHNLKLRKSAVSSAPAETNLHIVNG